MKTRRHIGLLLSTVLVLGTIVSPVVHYSWMALGGHFQVAAAAMPHNSAAHTGSAHASDEHRPGQPGPGTQASTDDLEHLTCDYSNLFGTFSAYPAPAPDVIAPGFRPDKQVVVASLVDAVASVDTIQLRGPPVV
ncbi:MAG: hypothetical protein RIE53_09625 [Rhodothermales bacterium]